MVPSDPQGAPADQASISVQMRGDLSPRENQNGFSLQPYRKSDREEVFAFLKSVYTQANSDRLIRQWDWKYDGNPFQCSADPYLLLLRKESRLIGMMGTFPLRFSVQGKRCWAACACDLIIQPSYRQQGLSRRVIKQYHSDHPVTCAWLNKISDRAAATLTISHCIQVGLLIKPLWPNFLPRKILGIRLPYGQKIGAEVIIEQLANVDHRFDALWERVGQGDFVMGVRDQAYLKWRFFDRPDATYTLFTATRNSNLVGYLIFRIVKKRGFRLGYLVDFLVEPKAFSILLLLVREATKSLRQEGAMAIICLTTHPSFQHLFRQQGFHPLFLLPKAYFRLRTIVPESGGEVVHDPHHCYLTFSDGDLEMGF